MLNKDIFKEGMQSLVIFFPNWTIKVEEPEVMKAWYLVFKDYNEEQFEYMVAEYIKKESYNPTVAGLIECRRRRNTTEIFIEPEERENNG